MANLDKSIGFPPPLLGDKPWRLPVLKAFSTAFLLEKPAGVLVDSGRKDLQSSTLAQGLQAQLKAKKPELLAMAPTGYVRPVFALDVEMAGAVLWANTPEANAALRSAFGAEAFVFTFELLVKGTGALAGTVEIDLPINYDPVLGRARVSHKYGKKAKTVFCRIAAGLHGYEIWQAQVRYLRPHQVRLHAAEAGLQILGENLYGTVPMPAVTDFKKRPSKGDLGLLYEGLAIRLSKWEGIVEEAAQSVLIPIPKPMKALYKVITGS